MAELVDLGLVSEANRLLALLIERHGLRWFLANDGARLIELEKSKIELVVRACVQSQKRRGHAPLDVTVEHCRKQVRRALIRRLAEAMVATGC